jgi:hypothetical protein
VRRFGEVAEVVESLPSKHEALSSNPNTAKTKQNKTNKKVLWCEHHDSLYKAIT